MEYPALSKPSIMVRLLCAAATAAGLAAAAPAYAAPIVIDYDLTGGAAFLSASGFARVTVSGTASGVDYSIVRFGVIDGATSWDFGGPMELTVEENGDFSTTDSLSATRRAGKITFDFPDIELPGGFGIVRDVDFTLQSNDSSLLRTDGGSGALNSAGALTGMIYDAPNAFRFDLPNDDHVVGPTVWGGMFEATNEGGGSKASLTPISGFYDADAIAAGALTGFTQSLGCQKSLRGICVLDAEVKWEWPDIQSSLSVSPATGTNATPLPVSPEAVTAPATIWLVAAGFAGLAGVGYRRRRRQTASRGRAGDRTN